MRLGQQAEAEGFRLTVFETTGSTNDEALQASSLGNMGKHWFVAYDQTAGRGRNGRQWSSNRGNLFSTLLLIDPCPTADLPKLGFVAGVAVLQAVRELVAEPQAIRLKWPNDLLASGAKLAGILLEGRALAGGQQAVAIGIGVNCAHCPDGLPYLASCLAQLGAEAGAEHLFEKLSDRIAANLTTFDRARGFDAIREAWLASAHGLSGPITVRAGTEPKSGIFSGIDDQGRLIFDDGNGRQLIHAADVAFPQASM